MKFDFVIGNPPYQDETTGDNKEFAPPIYHKFIESAYQVSNVVEMIHPARFLFNAGSTPKSWNEQMLHDPHMKVIFYEHDSSRIFTNTDIKGGVAVTYRDAMKNYGAIEVFTKYPELNSITSKVSPKSDLESLTSIIYTQNKFNLEVLYSDYPELKKIIGSEGKDKRFRNNIFDKIPLFYEKKQSLSDVEVLGVIKNKRNWRYIDKKYVDCTHENLMLWKVVVPRANGKGLISDVLSTPVVIGPNQAYTQTFIGIGAFDTREEANNTLKYIKCKFTRALLSVLKIDQHNEKATWRKIPLQNFSDKSDINWNVSIKDIDKQLYKKYNLADDEIKFIESHVKEME